MANFQTQLERSKLIQPEIVSKALFDFIRSIEKEMIQLNRDQINKDSSDIFGNAIGFYSKATEFITRGAKRAGDPFTGEDTGDWLKSFYVTVLDDAFYFGASDYKTKDILDSDNWLNKSLFGLTDENLNMLISQRIKPYILQYYRKSLAL